MATRLYPHTKNTVIIEKLLGVPEGTALRHAALNEPFKQAKAKLNEGFADLTLEQQAERRREYMRLDEAEWDANNSSEEIAKYDGFLTFGWGRVVHRHCSEPSGYTNDPVLVAQILRAQGVTLPPDVKIEDLEGLGWC
jgi:hypothetical protein